MWLTFYNLCQTIETPRTLLDYSVIYSKPWFWNSRNQPYNYFVRINNMLNKAKITFKRSFFNSNPLHWLNRIFFNSAACLHNICHFTNRNHLKTILFACPKTEFFSGFVEWSNILLNLLMAYIHYLMWFNCIVIVFVSE